MNQAEATFLVWRLLTARQRLRLFTRLWRETGQAGWKRWVDHEQATIDAIVSDAERKAA